MRLSHLTTLFIICLLFTSCVGKKKHNELIQALTATYELRADTLQNALDTAKQHIRKMELELAERKGENNALTALQDKLQGKIDALEEDLENLGAKASTQRTSLASQLKEKEAELAEKLQAVKRIQQLIKDSETNITAVSSELLDAISAYDSEGYSIEIISGKIVVAMTEEMLFRTGSTSRMNPDGVKAIESLCTILKKYPALSIEVVGHTDNRPVPRDGLDRWNYSTLRAATITKMMVEDFEINPNQVIAAGKGDYAPRASNETAEGRAKNKRVELVISPRQDLLLRDVEKALGKVVAE
ncbi:MAG: OmpA family protein [Saprospiraceae bacterium]